MAVKIAKIPAAAGRFKQRDMRLQQSISSEAFPRPDHCSAQPQVPGRTGSELILLQVLAPRP